MVGEKARCELYWEKVRGGTGRAQLRGSNGKKRVSGKKWRVSDNCRVEVWVVKQGALKILRKWESQ